MKTLSSRSKAGEQPEGITMATAVDAALAEIAAVLSVLQPQLEGLRDFQRLNLHPDTQAEILQSIEQYARREALLLSSQRELVALVGDGYPVLDARDIAQAVFADLSENAATIEAALAQFRPLKATTLNPSAGPVEPKP